MVDWYPFPCWRKNAKTSGSNRSVICSFLPGQRMAWRKKRGSNWGISESSIFESGSASIFFQLVFHGFFEEFTLMASCLSQGDDPNATFTAFRESDYRYSSVRSADTNPPVFAIILPGIRKSQH